jgi:hypothetical protein
MLVGAIKPGNWELKGIRMVLAGVDRGGRGDCWSDKEGNGKDGE